MNQEEFERLGLEFGFEGLDELKEQLKEYSQLCKAKAKIDNGKTFDEKYTDIIQEMEKYLIENHLKMISFTNIDGWRFKLNIPQKDFQKQLDKLTSHSDKKVKQ